MGTLEGQRILVTGASGLIGRPVAEHLALRNEVFALARFTDPVVRGYLEAAGVHTTAADVREVTGDNLPDGLDYVVHAGAMTAGESERARPDTFETNVQATGRLMRLVGTVKGFVSCSSGSVYAYQGQRPLNEDDPFGLHNGIPTYSASKIAAESVVEFLCRERQVPTTVIRIFTVYGPAGGTITSRIDLVDSGKPVPIYPGGPNLHSPMYIDDAVEKVEVAATVAAVPPLVVNFAGSETCSVQEYTKMAADLLGVDVSYRVSDTAYYPICADVTKMHATLGRCRVSVADGVRRVIETRDSRRETAEIHRVPG